MRTITRLFFLVTLFGMIVQAHADDTKKCETGPISRTFESTEWLIYSCNDNVSLVVITAPGNPATPFYFMMYPDKGNLHIVGEGTGNKKITDAVLLDLQKLSNQDIVGLIKETKSVPKK